MFSIYRAHRNETKSFWNVENRQLIAQINVLCEKGQIHAKGQMVGKVDFIAWQISWGLCIRNGHNRNARRELLNHKLLVFRYVKFHDCIAISEFKMPHARYIAGYCVNECQDILPTQKQSSRQQTISKYRPPPIKYKLNWIMDLKYRNHNMDESQIWINWNDKIRQGRSKSDGFSRN